MEKWFVTMKKADFQSISEKYHISPILARLIRNREVIGEEAIDFYLNGTIADLYDGMLMKDMDKAVEILSEKIRERAAIRIIGDYDIDGVNATYILQEGLAGLGADVDTDIPDRIRDGYGLNRNLIDRALEDGIDTIITCDNGIAAGEEILYGKERGLTVIVTDHHEIPFLDAGGEKEYLLPQADAVVDPHRPDCEYPFKGLCGAAVAYKLVEALYEVMQRDAEDVDYLMENVAIATIGDVMDLVDENRIFVKQGLDMLKRTENLGLKALMECTGVNVDKLSPYHIGFVIGPCMNASGRLDTAARSLKLLCAETEDEAAKLAGDLTALNQSRKALTEEGKEAAIRIVEETEIGQDRVLVIYLPDCHESLAGIIAGRIREKYNKPVFVLTKGETMVKGSGRSIESYSMFEELVKCGDLMEQYGGHPMAAGLSIKEENVEEFRRRLNENCTLTEKDLTPKILIDVPMPVSYINKELVEEISLLEPFGKGNTKPIFAQKGLRVLSSRILGKNRNVAKLQLSDGAGCVVEAVYFGEADEFVDRIKNCGSMAVTYYPEINRYQGRETLQIVIRNYITE